MPVCTVGDLVDALWRNRLIDLPLLEELADRTRAPAESPGVLAQELVSGGRLTRFQADECLAGRSASLALGPYRFLDLLGHGALGRVYRARGQGVRPVGSRGRVPHDRVRVARVR